MADNKLTVKRKRYHIWILALTLFLFPIGAALTGMIGSLSPITLLLAIYLLVSFFCTFSQDRRITKASLLVLLYFIYVVVSLVFGWKDVYQRWYVTNVLLNALFFFMVATDKYSVGEMKLIRNAVIHGILLAAFVALICRIRSNENRLIIEIFSQIDPNEFGFNMCFCAALMLSNLTLGKHKLRSGLGVLICAVLIIMTGSRGSMLAFAAEVAVWFLLYCKRMRLRIILCGLIAFAIFSIIFREKIGSYLLSRLNVFASLKADGGSGRLQIWKSALEKFNGFDLKHKLFGYGFGTFPNVVNYIAQGHTKPYEAHNIFIDCLITGGIFGCILLFGAFAGALLYGLKHKNIWGLLAVTALFVASMALDLQNYKAFAIVFAINALYKDTKVNKPLRRKSRVVKCNCTYVQNRTVPSRMSG